jgi:hypothetical protein
VFDLHLYADPYTIPGRVAMIRARTTSPSSVNGCIAVFGASNDGDDRELAVRRVAGNSSSRSRQTWRQPRSLCFENISWR